MVKEAAESICFNIKLLFFQNSRFPIFNVIKMRTFFENETTLVPVLIRVALEKELQYIWKDNGWNVLDRVITIVHFSSPLGQLSKNQNVSTPAELLNELSTKRPKN